MKRSNPSPLSTRDPNQQHHQRNDDDDDDIQQINEDYAICAERIKERFHRDFLPKYGYLWRRMVKERKKTVSVSGVDVTPDITGTDTGTGTSISPLPSDPARRVLNFVDAIERKETVTINGITHDQECECGCAPPIEDFVVLDEDEHAENNAIDLTITEDPTAQSKARENNEAAETIKNSLNNSNTIISDEETETEIDEGDILSVYETAEEFGQEESDFENTEEAAAFIEDEAYSVGTDDSDYDECEEEGQRTAGNDSTSIINVDADDDLEQTKDDRPRIIQKLRKIEPTDNSDEDNAYEEIDGDEDIFGFGLSRLNISTKEKDIKGGTTDPTIGAGQYPCSSPHSFIDNSSSGYNDLVDTENEADDEQDTESEDDKEEAEWIPDDDESLPTSTKKSNPAPTNQAEEKFSKRTETSETIDLCDSSSDNGGDSDFTVEIVEEDDLNYKKKFAATPISKNQIKSKAAFRRNRDRITNSAFEEFNRNAFGGKIGKVEVQWSKKLNTTAGLTRLQKLSVDMTPGVPLKRHAIIELSTKVLDDEEKLRTTLLHELVHAAVWILEGVSKPPHGADFKRWAKIAMSKVPDVTVTTTHNYEIQYKFNWGCVNPKCSFTIGRHSRSVDTIRHRCGLCKGKLIELASDGAPKKRAQPSAYNLFVKEHSKTVREQLIKHKPGLTQSDVMKELGRLWREHKKKQSGK